MNIDENVRLFYDKERNIMIDEGGYVVHNIFYIISPMVLWLFKHKKEYMIAIGQQGELVELFYPVGDEDDPYYYDF